MSNNPPEKDGKNASEAGPCPSGIADGKRPDKEERPDDKASVFHALWVRIRKPVEIVIALAAVMSLALAVKLWQESAIDKAVQKELSDEAILRKIAAQAQPMLIFDEAGGFISDSGGLAYIDRIVIEERDGSFPTKLLVKPKRLLSQPPLLTTIDGILLEYGTQRREGLDWEYSITNRLIQRIDWNSKSCRFRLEILRNP
jgi:hypothetical protein